MKNAGVLLRVSVVADADPGGLARVIQRFTNLNVVPLRVNAVLGGDGALRIEVDVFGVPEETLSVMTAKIHQIPCVMTAAWHPV
jgi:hypothetical protein